MPWTETTRAHYRREDLRYASDVTDQEWAVLAPLLPSPSRLGRPRRWDLRPIVDAILYVLAAAAGDAVVAQEGAFGTYLLSADLTDPSIRLGPAGRLSAAAGVPAGADGLGLQIDPTRLSAPRAVHEVSVA